MIVEVWNDVIAALNHLTRRFREARLVAINQRDEPCAGRMKEQATKKKQRAIADTDSRAVLAIYRSCEFQVGTQNSVRQM
jgi:hypothetical protein